jgi:hypothetical protein
LCPLAWFPDLGRRNTGIPPMRYPETLRLGPSVLFCLENRASSQVLSGVTSTLNSRSHYYMLIFYNPHGKLSTGVENLCTAEHKTEPLPHYLCVSLTVIASSCLPASLIPEVVVTEVELSVTHALSNNMIVAVYLNFFDATSTSALAAVRSLRSVSSTNGCLMVKHQMSM